jgi:hypothetical protein
VYVPTRMCTRVCVCVCVQFVCRFDAYCSECWVTYTCTNFVLSHTAIILLQNRACWCYVVNSFPKFFIIISGIVIIYCYLMQLLLYTYCHSHGSYYFRCLFRLLISFYPLNNQVLYSSFVFSSFKSLYCTSLGICCLYDSLKPISVVAGSLK